MYAAGTSEVCSKADLHAGHAAARAVLPERGGSAGLRASGDTGVPSWLAELAARLVVLTPALLQVLAPEGGRTMHLTPAQLAGMDTAAYLSVLSSYLRRSQSLSRKPAGLAAEQLEVRSGHKMPDAVYVLHQPLTRAASSRTCERS